MAVHRNASTPPDQGPPATQTLLLGRGGRAVGRRDVVVGGRRQELFHHQFAADDPADQAALMVATQRPATQGALSDGLPSETPAGPHLPSWFVFGDQDLNIPVALQRFMADGAGSKGTREIAGGSRAIIVSQPDAVTATILDAVATL